MAHEKEENLSTTIDQKPNQDSPNPTTGLTPEPALDLTSEPTGPANQHPEKPAPEQTPEPEPPPEPVPANQQPEDPAPEQNLLPIDPEASDSEDRRTVLTKADVAIIAAMTESATEAATDTTEPTIDPAIEPTTEPTADHITEPTEDHITDPTTDHITEPTTDHIIDQTTEPTTDHTIDQITEPTTDHTIDQTTEPATEPATEPTDSSTPATPSELKQSQTQTAPAKTVAAQTPPEPASPRKKISLKLALTLIGLALLAVGFSTVFSLTNIGNDKILYSIKINDVDVYGLTKEEASQKIQTHFASTAIEEIALTLGDTYAETLVPKDIGFFLEIEDAVDEAHNLGRSGNFISNNYAILRLLFQSKNIQCPITYDTDKLTQVVKNIANTIPNRTIENSHYIEDDTLIIVRGTSGIVVNEPQLESAILQALQANQPIIQIPTNPKNVDEIDIEQIHSDIHSDPKDAYFTNEDGKYQIFPHVLGYSFSIPQAKQTIEQDITKGEYTIPLQITYPQTTIDRLGIEAFPHQLSKFSTKYDASVTGRSENLRVASDKINEKVLMPGDTFSYNDVLGKRTIENGYKEANAYSGGKIVIGIGGGICQISTTLYNAVLLANLDIVERTNHSMPISYVDPGFDATVYYGILDFQFKNNRSYPIKILARASSGTATIEIYGFHEEVEYEVVLESVITETLNYATEYETVSGLKPNQEIIVQNGSNGCRCIAYRILKLDGAIVSRTVLSTDKYAPLNKIVQRGPAAPTPAPDPSPDPIPDPAP